ncbi:5882_t:CDS:1, partial [Rhizophagus irregularis]
RTVWIHNKLDKGTVALVAATDFLGSGKYDWDAGFGAITGD